MCILSSILSFFLAISIHRFRWCRGIRWIVLVFSSVQQVNSFLMGASTWVYIVEFELFYVGNISILYSQHSILGFILGTLFWIYMQWIFHLISSYYWPHLVFLFNGFHLSIFPPVMYIYLVGFLCWIFILSLAFYTESWGYEVDYNVRK